jgi:hypothetical protein
MLPTQLERLVTFLTDHQDIELVYADLEVIDESGLPSVDSSYSTHYRDLKKPNIVRWPRDPGRLNNLLYGNFIGACFLYRTWAASIAGGYLPDAFGFEDYEYWMRMNCLFRAAHLGTTEVLYRYRVHDSSLTSQAVELSLKDRTAAFLAGEGERRDLYATSGTFILDGEHPWFQVLTQVLVEAGHHVERCTRVDKITPCLVIHPSEPARGNIIANISVAHPAIRFCLSDPEPEHAISLAYPLTALLAERCWEIAKRIDVPRRPSQISVEPDGRAFRRGATS